MPREPELCVPEQDAARSLSREVVPLGNGVSGVRAGDVCVHQPVFFPVGRLRNTITAPKGHFLERWRIRSVAGGRSATPARSLSTTSAHATRRVGVIAMPRLQQRRRAAAPPGCGSGTIPRLLRAGRSSGLSRLPPWQSSGPAAVPADDSSVAEAITPREAAAG